MMKKIKNFITCTVLLILSLAFIPCTCVATMALEDLPPVESYYEQGKYYDDCYEAYDEIGFILYHSIFYPQLKLNLKSLDEVESWESLEYLNLLNYFERTFKSFFPFITPQKTKLEVATFYFYIVFRENAEIGHFDLLKKLSKLLSFNGIDILNMRIELFSDEKSIPKFQF